MCYHFTVNKVEYINVLTAFEEIFQERFSMYGAE